MCRRVFSRDLPVGGGTKGLRYTQSLQQMVINDMNENMNILLLSNIIISLKSCVI